MLFALIVLAVWLLVVSLFFIRFYLFFRKLTKGAENVGLDKILTKILQAQKANSGSISAIEREIKAIEEGEKTHIQKIGIVRFNPFEEIGGDHSFSLAMLDGVNSGIIITCLHTRERTRVYMKAVKNGKCELGMSDEEKKALEKAV